MYINICTRVLTFVYKLVIGSGVGCGLKVGKRRFPSLLAPDLFLIGLCWLATPVYCIDCTSYTALVLCAMRWEREGQSELQPDMRSEKERNINIRKSKRERGMNGMCSGVREGDFEGEERRRLWRGCYAKWTNAKLQLPTQCKTARGLRDSQVSVVAMPTCGCHVNVWLLYTEQEAFHRVLAERTWPVAAAAGVTMAEIDKAKGPLSHGEINSITSSYKSAKCPRLKAHYTVEKKSRVCGNQLFH